MVPSLPDSDDTLPLYTSGTATLRSSAHRTVYAKSRRNARPAEQPSGPLPASMKADAFLPYDLSRHDLRPAITALLQRVGRCLWAMPLLDRVISPAPGAWRWQPLNS